MTVNLQGLLPLVLLGVVGYMLLIRPARKRQQEQAATVRALAPGREVMTTGGLFGTVVSIVDDVIELEIAPGVRVRYLQQAVAKVVSPPEPDSDEAAEDVDLSTGEQSDATPTTEGDTPNR